MNDILTIPQWIELRDRIRIKHPELTDDDMQYHESSERDYLTMLEYLLRQKMTVKRKSQPKSDRMRRENAKAKGRPGEGRWAKHIV